MRPVKSVASAASGSVATLVSYTYLDSSLRQRLKDEVLVRTQGLNPYDKSQFPSFFREAAKSVQQVVPTQLLESIRRSTMHPSYQGYAVVEGLPSDDVLCPTPLDGVQPKGKLTFVTEAVHLGLSFHGMGLQPFTYTSVKEHQLIHTIVPVKGKEHVASNAGSTTHKWHQERTVTRKACNRNLPDIDALSLACLRADHERRATTTLFPFSNLPASFLRDFKEVLRSPEFFFEFPQYMPESLPMLQAPILHFSEDGHPAWCFNANGMHCTTSRAENALQALEEVMESSHVQIRMEPGHAVFINNRTCLHARGVGFKPKYDGKDRWLIRSFWSVKPRACIIDE